MYTANCRVNSTRNLFYYLAEIGYYCQNIFISIGALHKPFAIYIDNDFIAAKLNSFDLHKNYYYTIRFF